MNDERTCKTCKHWLPPNEVESECWGVCESPRLIDSWGLSDDDLPPDGFGMGKQSGMSSLYTGPDFGCIHHEAKE